MTTPNRRIPYVPENTLDPAAGLNLALNFIDALLQTSVISMAIDTPPGSPSDGDLYIVATGGTGAWAGLDDYLVRYVAEGDLWQSFAPGDEVSLIINREDGNLYKYLDITPGGWVAAAGLGDAPNDGRQYVRQSLSWAALVIPPAPVVTESTTSRSALPAHAGDYTRFTHADPKMYEFDGGESWVVGSEFHGRNHGAGPIEISGTGGMTVNLPTDGSEFIPQGGTFTVKVVSENEADLFGVTVPQS